jgi:hypothetical protein
LIGPCLGRDERFKRENRLFSGDGFGNRFCKHKKTAEFNAITIIQISEILIDSWQNLRLADDEIEKLSMSMVKWLIWIKKSP